VTVPQRSRTMIRVFAAACFTLALAFAMESWRRSDWEYGSEDAYYSAEDETTYHSAGGLVFSLLACMSASVSVAAYLCAARRRSLVLL